MILGEEEFLLKKTDRKIRKYLFAKNKIIMKSKI